VLYFVGVFCTVHFRAVRLGLKGIDKDEVPPFLQTLKKIYLMLPLAGIVVLLIGLCIAGMRYGAMAALGLCIAVIAVLGIVISISLKSAARGALSKSPLVLDAVEGSAEGYDASTDMQVFLGREGETRTVLRPVGIVAGLLIVPVTTVFMIGSLVWLVSGFALGLIPGIQSLVQSLLAKPLSFLYQALEQIVSLAARAPGFVISGWIPVLAVSLLVLCLVWYLERRRSFVTGRLVPLL
jgi:hypothetical protein